MQEYNLPLRQKSSLGRHMIFSVICYILLFTATIYLIFSFIIYYNFVFGIICTIIMIIFDFIWLYILLFAGILKVFYIEITSEYIKAFLPFKSWTAYWKDVKYVRYSRNKSDEIISIMLSRDIEQKKKRTIFNNFSSLLNAAVCSYYITLNIFKDIDAGILYRTMDNQLKRTPSEDWERIETLTGNYEEPCDSILKAIIGSVFLSIVIGIAGGFLIGIFKKAYVIVSILGCGLVIAVFDEYYLKESPNWLVRLLAGLICAIQVPITIFIEAMLTFRLELTGENACYVMSKYMDYLFHNPMELAIILIILFSCFGLGVYMGGRKSAFNKYSKR